MDWDLKAPEAVNQENLELLITEIEKSTDFDMVSGDLCIGGKCGKLLKSPFWLSPAMAIEQWLGVSFDEGLYICRAMFSKTYSHTAPHNYDNLKATTKEMALDFLRGLRK